MIAEAYTVQPTITKAKARQIIASGMSVWLYGLQGAALFWVLAEERAGRVARFTCEITDTVRFRAA